MNYPTREEIVSAYLDLMSPEEKEDLLWHYLMFDETGVPTCEMETKILRVACEEALDGVICHNRMRVHKLREESME